MVWLLALLVSFELYFWMQGMFYNFEIFHMREKNVPVDSVCEFKEPISAFAWEPIGNKFAIIHGEQNSISVSFYGVLKGVAPVLLSKYI